MTQGRLVGIDLGIASAHTVRVLREDGSEVCRRRCWPRLDSPLETEAAALAGAPPEVRLEVVIEPTGPAWLPVAVCFTGRGHAVYRSARPRPPISAASSPATPSPTASTRDPGSPAPGRSRRPAAAPAPGGRRRQPRPPGPGHLPAHATGCRAQAADQDLVRQLLPTIPLQGALGRADLAVLERTGAHPGRLLAMGKPRLNRLISRASNEHLGEERAQAWLDAAHRALELCGDHPALAFEIAPPIRSPRSASCMPPWPNCPRTSRLANRPTARSTPTSWPAASPVSPPSGDRRWPPWSATPAASPIAPASAPSPAWPPRASETGETDRKCQPMSKAGPRLLRTTLLRAAETARHLDPQLARLYYVHVVEPGACHLEALCVVAPPQPALGLVGVLCQLASSPSLSSSVGLPSGCRRTCSTGSEPGGSCFRPRRRPPSRSGRSPSLCGCGPGHHRRSCPTGPWSAGPARLS